MRTIVNLIGHPGSGKSSVAEYLHDSHGFETLSPSDAMRDGHRSPPTLEAFMADEAADTPLTNEAIALATYQVDALCPPGTVQRRIDAIIAEVTAHERQA